nr:immunoglobulin light chain junction region [Macaca mulatta]MOW07907.1 immunoglobulin light chain junction region [Macaca mulatta]MOW07912.1 immunoglobulin light chain junction region [Macaca mulatta]MOW08135.1 immunoglobulin light chain junction region [Macaca mulatta]MOW08189.1 immunoglobulin light chain junction region [Macaca mulatta]
CLQYNSSPFTF